MIFVFSVAKAILNTEVTEAFRAHCVEALATQSSRRISFRLQPARALSFRNNPKPPRLR